MKSAIERFHDGYRANLDSDCWTWGSTDRKGYGRFSVHGEFILAHRFSYEAFVGPIPRRREIDHTCFNRACVRPAHLEAVSHRENVARGVKVRSHCRRGHEYSPENTRVRRYAGRKNWYRGRACRTCERAGYASRKAADACPR